MYTVHHSHRCTLFQLMTQCIVHLCQTCKEWIHTTVATGGTVSHGKAQWVRVRDNLSNWDHIHLFDPSQLKVKAASSCGWQMMVGTTYSVINVPYHTIPYHTIVAKMRLKFYFCCSSLSLVKGGIITVNQQHKKSIKFIQPSIS